MKKKIFVDFQVVTSFSRGDEVRRYAETIKAKMVTSVLVSTEFSVVHKNQLTTTPCGHNNVFYYTKMSGIIEWNCCGSSSSWARCQVVVSRRIF